MAGFKRTFFFKSYSWNFLVAKKMYFSLTILMINRIKDFTFPSPLSFIRKFKKKIKNNLPFLYLVFLVLLTYKQENLEKK